MCAVKNIMISESVFVWRTLLKNAPSMGMSPKSGTFAKTRDSSLPMSPPMTMVSPSFKRTVVSAERSWNLYALRAST